MKIKKILEYKLKGERNISSRKPLIIENNIFVIFIFDKQGSTSSKLISFDKLTFKINWEYNYPFVINNISLSSNKTILVCCMDGKLEELDLNNGNSIKTIDLNLERNGQSSKIVENKIIIGGIQGTKQTTCVDLKTSQIIWTVDNGGHSYIPLITNNKVYQCTEKNINCFDLNSGKIKWNAREEKTYIFNPTVFKNYIIVGGHGLLNIYDKETGKLFNQIRTGIQEVVRQIVSNNDNIYFGDSSGKFYCYKIKTKKNIFERPKVLSELIWKYSTNGCIESTPIINKESVLFINDDNKLISLNIITGKLNWTFNTKGEAGISGVTIEDDAIYTSVGKGFLYKLNEE